MNRISKKLLLILFFICILVAIATWYVIRLSNSVSVINNSEDPVSLPVSFIQDSTSIVPNTELHESKESLDNNNQPPTNSPQVITHEIIKPNTNPFPNTNNGPTNLPYEKSPYCTDESTFFEARIFTGDYIHIQQGSNAGIYAETLHNCTNPEIVKTWIDMTTGATLSNRN